MRSAFAATALLLVTSVASAGMTYDFKHVSTGVANQTISGKVKAEGQSIRIDVGTGDGMLFRNGSFVVSTDGGKTMRVADPATKTFYRIDLGTIAGSTDALLKQFGDGVKVDVRAPRVSVSPAAAGGTIEGFATRKSRVNSAYEIAIDGLGQPLTMKMELTSDVWWTEQIPAEFTNFLQMRGLRTGMEAVDKLIAAQAATIDGFPLRQVTTTRVSLGGNDMTTTTTMTVSNVKRGAVPAGSFQIPTGYAETPGPFDGLTQRPR